MQTLRCNEGQCFRARETATLRLWPLVTILSLKTLNTQELLQGAAFTTGVTSVLCIHIWGRGVNKVNRGEAAWPSNN